MLKHFGARLELLLVILLTIGCDRVTKHVATTALAGEPRPVSRTAGLAFFDGGGTSNWIDRVLCGYVVDLMNVGLGPLRTGIFNVADVALIIGIVPLIVPDRWRPKRTL